MNVYTTDSQSAPDVGVDTAGNFVVVWQSFAQDGSGSGVFGQRYDSSGARVGTEFQVNTYTTNNQYAPAVSVDNAGNFVVVWSLADTFAHREVLGQRYDSSGARVGTEFQANTTTTSIQRLPHVGGDAAGNFVVVWESSNGQDGDLWGVFGQRYDDSGTRVGTEFQANTYTTSFQRFPQVSGDGAGNFVVVWESYFQDGSGYGIFGQRYDSGGGQAGTEFQVNTYTTSSQYFPQVRGDSAGNFVVLWDSPDGSSFGVFGQRYDSSGVQVGTEVQVNTYTTSIQRLPQVGGDGAGNFVVVWESYFQDGYGYGVFGQRYDSSGARAGTEFQVNTYTTNNQYAPQIRGAGQGTFVVVWQSWDQDGANFGVFGQRYALSTPTATPTATPTSTPTSTHTPANTPTATLTPTSTATLPPHDSVVLPREPLTVHVRNATPITKTVKVKVVNADILPAPETPGHTIKLSAGDGDCPAGTVVGTPHFVKMGVDLGDSILLAGGKAATAKVTLNISAAAFTGFNHVTPTRCTLQFSVTSPGNSDPVPGNDAVPMELNVIDHTDPEGSAVHESYLKSLAPLTLTIKDNKSSATKNSHPAAGNGDILPSPEDPGDALTVTPNDGTCPGGTVGIVDMNPTMSGTQNPVTVKGGKTTPGKLPVTVSSTLVTTNKKSPTRCIGTVTVAGPGGDTDATNNTSKLVIDVYDKNDF